jgi:hypothetical protein
MSGQPSTPPHADLEAAWSVRTPMRRLVAIRDDADEIEAAIMRHNANGWRLIPPAPGAPDHVSHFGLRLLAFRRSSRTTR